MFKRSILGYNRSEVEKALHAWSQAYAEVEAAQQTRERTIAAQRGQIDELDQVASRLAEMVADHRAELRKAEAELAQAAREADTATNGARRFQAPPPADRGEESESSALTA